MSISALATCQLTSTERQGISDALYVANLEFKDLVRERSGSPSKWLRESVNDPEKGLANLSELQTLSGQRNLAQLIGALRTRIFQDESAPDVPPLITQELPPEIPSVLAPSVRRLVDALQLSNDLIKLALKELDSNEKRTLIEALPRRAANSDLIEFSFVRQPLPEKTQINRLLAKVDLRLIVKAGHILATAVQGEIVRLKEAAKSAPLFSLVQVTIGGLTVEIGSTADDWHEGSNSVLCIDLGGNDRYTGRYGAGVGYAGVLIDLTGDDVYDGPDLTCGAGVLGVGIAFDLGGDDQFRGKSIVFGSGIAGFGALVKEGGSDDYRGKALGQGFGFHGWGIQIDTGGDDNYRIGTLGQGSAKDQGIGWLIDKSGQDIYRGGGLIPSTIVDSAWMSQAQGFADGTAALGMLTDLAGADYYLVSQHGQGNSRQGGLACLMDLMGVDVYTADRDAQASSGSNGASYLMDAQGDDSYLVRIGNGHGHASDFGMAILLDRVGSDFYGGSQSRPGSATSNGAAIFCDASGDDHYGGNPGIGNSARGQGSIAVFADLTGDDEYNKVFGNGQAKVEGNWGTALDLVGVKAPSNAEDPPNAGSKPMPGEVSMQALLGRALDDDRKAIRELIEIGLPGIKWIIEKRSGEADSRLVSLLGWLAMQIDGSETVCVNAIDLTKPPQADCMIQVCQFAEFKSAGPKVVASFEIPSLVRTAIRAAGALEVAEAVPKLSQMVLQAEFRLPSIISLSQIGALGSFKLFEGLIDSAEADLRFAAVTYLSKHPERATPVASGLASSPSERIARIGIEILGNIGTPETLDTIGKLLSDPRRGVLIQAMLALDTRCPKTYRAKVAELRKHSDPLVQAVASRIDFGR